jgi:erythromycin esterase-like protein
MSRTLKIYSLLFIFTFPGTSVVVGQSLSDDEKRSLQKFTSIIGSDSLSQPDWSALQPHLKNKKLILIGEFTHGGKEISQLRNSLIKYLHQNAGVNTILFESGIGELIVPNSDKENLTGKEMTYGLFGNWRTREFADLMEYVRAQQMSIAGFDVQRTGNSFTRVLKRLAKRFEMDTTTFDGLEVRYGSVARALTARGAIYDSLKDKVNVVIRDYQKAKNILNAINTNRKLTDLMMSTVVIDNRIAYLTYMLEFLRDSNWHRRWAARDSMMASNVQWLIENLYKNKPVVIIGHNFHISRHNENETVMGEFLKATYGKDMFAIGFFAAAGSYHDNSGKKVAMLPPDKKALDIKHVMAGVPGDVSFMYVPKKLAKDNAWLNRELIVNDTFIDLANTNRMNLAKSFDGLVLLKNVSPPDR